MDGKKKKRSEVIKKYRIVGPSNQILSYTNLFGLDQCDISMTIIDVVDRSCLFFSFLFIDHVYFDAFFVRCTKYIFLVYPSKNEVKLSSTKCRREKLSQFSSMNKNI